MGDGDQGSQHQGRVSSELLVSRTIIEYYVIGNIAPSPSIPLPEGEGRKAFSLGESEGRGQDGDEGAILNLILACNEFGNAQ
jgi:hypothetical protein